MDVPKLLDEHGAGEKKYQYEKSLIHIQSYEMANDKKWTWLAELALMQTDWTHLVNDILDGINKSQIVKEKPEDHGCEDEAALEENFDLQ